MDNIIDIELTGRSTRREQKLWQYDYGQVLRIAGKEFPKVTEVQFSLKQSGGHTLDRIGTSNNGLLTVQIPNELLQNKGATSDYTIYAFVYLSGDGFGNTKYMIQLPVESRPEPTDPSEDPSIDPSIFKDAVNAVNASAERAETAEKSAKESADKAKEYAESAGKSKEYVEKARDNAISAIGIEKESALRGIESKTEESLQNIQSQTEESQNGIKQSIADATEKKTELDGAISNATDAKGNLDKAVQSAGNAKTELESSIEKAGEAKMALGSSINSAGEKQLALDTTVERANTVDASLKEQIGSAEQIQANVEQIAKNKADISSLNEDLADYLGKASINLFDINDANVERGKAYNGTTGAITSNEHYLTSGFIDFYTTDIVRWSAPTTWIKTVAISLWDENKEFISAKKTLSNCISQENNIYTLKFDKTSSIYDSNWENAKYIRVAFYKDDNDFTQMMCVKNVDFPSEFIPYGFEYANELRKFIDEKVQTDLIPINNKTKEIQNSNILFNKKWVACGDSFTQGDFSGFTDENGLSGKNSPVIYDSEWNMYKTYPWWIGKRNNMTIVNEAISGSGFVNFEGARNPFSVNRYLAVPTDADYVTLMFGLNECNGLTDEKIGTKTDTTNETLWGAYNIVFEHFYRNMPYAKVGVIFADSWLTVKYKDAVKEMCRYWGIAWIDLGDKDMPLGVFKRDGVSISPVAQESRDSVFCVSSTNKHPNVKAHEYRSTFIEDFLRRL